MRLRNVRWLRADLFEVCVSCCVRCVSHQREADFRAAFAARESVSKYAGNVVTDVLAVFTMCYGVDAGRRDCLSRSKILMHHVTGPFETRRR